MPKFKPKNYDSDAELENYGDPYDGPLPPAGVYQGDLKLLRIKQNRNGDDMFNGLVEINDSRKEKKQYAGAQCWFNLNITDQGSSWVNNFLDAIGVKRKDFEAGNVVIDDSDPPNVTKIGAKRIENIQVRISTAIGTYKGEDKVEIKTFLALGQTTDEEDEERDREADGAEPEEEAAEEAAEPEDPEAGEEGGEEGAWAEDELKALPLNELKDVAKEWDVPVTAKSRASSLIAKILEAQEAEGEGEEGDGDPPF